MADLSSDFVGIKSPNPFWLASAPPTDKDWRAMGTARIRPDGAGLEVSARRRRPGGVGDDGR